MLNSEHSVPEPRPEDDSEWVDLRAYWALALRYWWVFVVVMAAAGGAAYAVGSLRTPLYSATAKVLVQSARVPGSFSAGDIEANRRFAEDFRDLLSTRPVLEAAADAMELATGSRSLGNIVMETTRSIVDITALDPDPQRAADVANALAQESIEQVQRRQLTQIAQFQASLSQYGIESDAALIAGQASTLSMLSIVEEAVPAMGPVASGTTRNIALALLLSFILTWLGVALREYLDDRVRSPDQLRNLTGVPSISDMLTIGSVIRYRGGDGHEPLIIDDDPPPALTEAYKFLQTNLQFAALGTDGLKSILITSSNPTEGKTTTAINLATSIAREGASTVLLVDADLRRPNLHRLFDLGEHKGLTHLLLGTATLDEVARPTQIDGLRVIPAGVVPPDPPKLLRSERMREVVAELEESADLVFFDSPPLLAVTDPMIVASLVDAVLLVIESGRTRRDLVKLAVRMIERANPQFISTVLNKVAPRAENEYGYGYYVYREDGSGDHNGGGPGFIPRALVKLRIRKPKPNGTRDGAREKHRASS